MVEIAILLNKIVYGKDSSYYELIDKNKIKIIGGRI